MAANYIRQNKDIVKGDELWLFLGVRSAQDTEATPVPVCFATTCSLNRSKNTTSVSSKDHGNTSFVVPGEGSWTCSTEQLMSIKSGDGNGAVAFSEVMDAMDKGYLVDVKFGKLNSYTAANLGTGIVDQDNAVEWQLDTNSYWYGAGYITSLQATGSHGDSATFSCEITGSGPLLSYTYSYSGQ